MLRSAISSLSGHLLQMVMEAIRLLVMDGDEDAQVLTDLSKVEMVNVGLKTEICRLVFFFFFFNYKKKKTKLFSYNIMLITRLINNLNMHTGNITCARVCVCIYIFHGPYK